MQERYQDRIVREALEAEDRRRRDEEWQRQCRKQQEEVSRRERMQARTPRSESIRPSTPAGNSAFLSITLVFLAGFMIFTCAHRGDTPATKKKSTAPRVEPHRHRHR